jgi:hypothetical protein
MRDISVDLRERLEATVKQRMELEARERRLRALLRDEEVAQSSCLASNKATGEPRLGEFVLDSLKDGHDWTLEALKEHAYGIGLTTGGASGRALNITLVTLLRQGLVTRLQDGKWRLRDQSQQLVLSLAQSSEPNRPDPEAGARPAS